MRSKYGRTQKRTAKRRVQPKKHELAFENACGGNQKAEGVYRVPRQQEQGFVLRPKKWIRLVLEWYDTPDD